MSDFGVSLSATGIKNAVIDDIHEDFTFIVREMCWTCPRSIARFFSPTVFLLHSIDASIAEYAVQHEDCEDLFDSFMSVTQGSSVSVAEDNGDVFLSFAQKLGNVAIYCSLLDRFHPNFRDARRMQDLDFLPSCTIGAIEFLSSHFYELTSSELDIIPSSVFYHIISHDSLTISSEDALCDYLCSRISRDLELAELLQFVRFEYLLVGSICLNFFSFAVQNWC
jgi:hypothetical protein